MARYRVGPLSQITPGTMWAGTVADRDIIIVRHDDGTCKAFPDRCTHADVALSDGSFSRGEIECPAHGARFNGTTGAALCMPAVRGLSAFPVVVENDDLYVEFGE